MNFMLLLEHIRVLDQGSLQYVSVILCPILLFLILFLRTFQVSPYIHSHTLSILIDFHIHTAIF